MVGVPGRSKACHTCKRRKKGCDEKEPSCGQCITAGILCGGYDKARIFVNSSQKHGNTKTHHFIPGSYTLLPLPKTRVGSRSPQEFLSSTLASLPAFEQTLAHGPLQSQYFDNFWSSLLPNGQVFSAKAALCSTAGWTGVVQELSHREGPVRFALLANALGVLGEQSGRQAITVEAWLAYGRSLQLLVRAIPAVSEEQSDELFATSILLAEYELLQAARNPHSASASANRWYRHASGEAALILSRGPESYVTGRSHKLFIDSRLHLIYPHIRNRTPSPLSTPEWKSIPWSIHSKDPKNELLDILIEIPTVLYNLNQLIDAAPDPIQKFNLCESLEEKIWDCDFQLQQWSVTSGSFAVDFVETCICGENIENSAPTSENYATAHLGILYWTTCLLLYPSIYHIDKYKEMRLPKRVEPRQYCRKIMLLLPYFQNINIGAFFVNIAVFPATSVMRFLDRNEPPDRISEERKMFMRVFKGKHRRQIENFLDIEPWRSEKMR